LLGGDIFQEGFVTGMATALHKTTKIERQ